MSDALRRAFESWCCKRWAGDRGALTRRQDGEYINGHVEFAWCAWVQSARVAALAAAAPEPQPVITQAMLDVLCNFAVYDAPQDRYIFDGDDMRAALEAAIRAQGS